MFLFKNRLGNSYEVTEEQKEKIIKNNSGEEKDFVEIKEVTSNFEGNTIVSDENEEFTELQILRAEYKQKFEKNVPQNKTKDIEWIKEKLSTNE